MNITQRNALSGGTAALAGATLGGAAAYCRRRGEEIYAMVRHLSLTIAAVCEDGDDYREWINSLMDEFRNELEQKPEPVG